MNNYSENGHFHDHDRFYVPVHQSSSEWSEWSASLSAGTPMTRRLSEESAISTSSSSDLVLTPSSEYGAYDSIWPSTPAGDQYFLRSSPVSDSNDEFTPTSYNPLYRGDYIASNRSDYNTEAQDPWWNYYDFVTDLEPNQAPFWRLRPGFEPTDQFPATRAHETTYSTDPHPPRNEGLYICMEPDCPKSFGRKADLQRHLAQMHTSKEKKLKYPCDWKKCQRAKSPFGRRDHQRDHYRQFHHEDIIPRGSAGREDSRWWNSRNVDLKWWRCARCLTRVKVGDYGYTCPGCKISCEGERRRYREAM